MPKLVALALSLSLLLPLSSASAAEPFTFKKTKLDEKFRGEGVAVGDFNHDGFRDGADLVILLGRWRSE